MLSERDRQVLSELERQFGRDGAVRRRLFDAAPSTIGLPRPVRQRAYTWTATIAAMFFMAAVLLNVPAIAMSCGGIALLALPLRARAAARNRSD